jgi:hypothetical protein
MGRYQIIPQDENEFTFYTNADLEVDDVLIQGEKRYLLTAKANTRDFFAKKVDVADVITGKIVYAHDKKL